MTNAEARFNKSLRPRKPEGSLGRTAQDGHLDSHTAPELCTGQLLKVAAEFIDLCHWKECRVCTVDRSEASSSESSISGRRGVRGLGCGGGGGGGGGAKAH